MQFILSIDCDKSAFRDDPGAEVARILQEQAIRVGMGIALDDRKILVDSNGNRVGQWQVCEGVE